MIEDYRTPANLCLDCGQPIDGAAPVGGGRAPQEGDISICLYCQHIMVFAADQTVRPLTDDEVVEIAGNPEVIRAIKLAGEFNRKRDKNAAHTPPDDRSSRRRRPF